jgi:thiol-disulfide isomerase/thioredoxin
MELPAHYAFAIVLVLLILVFMPCPCGCGCTGWAACRCMWRRNEVMMTLTPVEPEPAQQLEVNAIITQPETVVADAKWPWLTPHTTGVRVVHASIEANMITLGSVDSADPTVEGFESFPLNVPAQRINEKRRVYLHSVKWCHYCKGFKPVWEQLKSMNIDQDIIFEEIDGDVAKDPSIQSYPTIIMLDEYGNRRKYDGQRELPLLNQWLHGV